MSAESGRRKMTCMECGHQYELQTIPTSVWGMAGAPEKPADMPRGSWWARLLHLLGRRAVTRG